MCGIFGYIGRPMQGSKMAVLMMYNESRGGHACGFYSDRTGIVKDKVKAPEFLSIYPMPERASIFIGHTRWGTMGFNTKDNAHPYEKGQIIGVHNGCLQNERQVGKDFDIEYCVDSEVIFSMIDKYGPKGIEEIQGSMALAWVDENRNLNLYRRDNPIYFNHYKGGLVFSSLKDSLFAIGFRDSAMLKPDVVYTLNHNGELIREIALRVKHVKTVYTKNWDDDRKAQSAYGYYDKKGNWVPYKQHAASATSGNYGRSFAHGWDESNPKQLEIVEVKTEAEKDKEAVDKFIDKHAKDIEVDKAHSKAAEIADAAVAKVLKTMQPDTEKSEVTDTTLPVVVVNKEEVVSEDNKVAKREIKKKVADRRYKQMNALLEEMDIYFKTKATKSELETTLSGKIKEIFHANS